VTQPGDSPTVARLQLGARLKALRLAANIDQSVAGAALHATGSKISRVESGQVPVRERDVEALLSLYD
jgi:transcriptional regulator with XRE-family HTH domain